MLTEVLANPTPLSQFNQLATALAWTQIFRCCSSNKWADLMVASRPYHSMAQLAETANTHWQCMEEPDLLEAFAGHPQIGDMDLLDDDFPKTDGFASHGAPSHDFAIQEQASVAQATMRMSELLAQHNLVYLTKFGFIFIICASGKSPEQMLELLQSRGANTREQELVNAAEEQRKITQLRIEKAFIAK